MLLDALPLPVTVDVGFIKIVSRATSPTAADPVEISSGNNLDIGFCAKPNML